MFCEMFWTKIVCRSFIPRISLFRILNEPSTNQHNQTNFIIFLLSLSFFFILFDVNEWNLQYEKTLMRVYNSDFSLIIYTIESRLWLSERPPSPLTCTPPHITQSNKHTHTHILNAPKHKHEIENQNKNDQNTGEHLKASSHSNRKQSN